MQVPKVILLTGFKESGKNAVADIITRLYGHEQIAFADPLKDKLAELIADTDLIPSDMPSEIVAWIKIGSDALDKYLNDSTKWDDPGEPVSMVVRHFHAENLVRQKPYQEWQRKGLQLLGTEYYRAKDSFFWIKSMHLDPDQSYVITDGRFHNEVAFGEAVGACVIRIYRPGSDPLNYGDDFDKLHASERFIPELFYHYSINNNKDGLDLLEDAVKASLVEVSSRKDYGATIFPMVNV